MKQLLLTLSANHFVNTTKKLKLKPTETASKELAQSEILDKYKDHQFIDKIWPRMTERIYFHSACLI